VRKPSVAASSLTTYELNLIAKEHPVGRDSFYENARPNSTNIFGHRWRGHEPRFGVEFARQELLFLEGVAGQLPIRRVPLRTLRDAFKRNREKFERDEESGKWSLASG
jgi:hypothetical protein